MAVPYTFGSATASIPLSQLDSNFATTITMGNTAVQLGNTVTTLNNMTLGNVTVSSGNVVAGIASGTITQAMLGTNVAGNGPAFSAYASSGTAVASSVQTKIAFQVEEWDTASAFDNATNYRFQPTTSGYYQVTSLLQLTPTGAASIWASIYKNGSSYKQGTRYILSAICNVGVTAQVFLNGSTDYIEIYLFQNTGLSVTTSAGSDVSYFQASMVRSA